MVIGKLFRLRQRALIAGVWKHTAVALVLGRGGGINHINDSQEDSEDDHQAHSHKKKIKTEHSPQATSTTSTSASTSSTVCILHELSFGNVPLAANILATLAAIPAPSESAPRQNVHFDPPPYADVTIRTSSTAEWYEATTTVARIANERPHLLQVTGEHGDGP